jgi:hypothetical protein
MVAMTWRAPARVSVSGTQGWYPLERLDVVHSTGAALVSVETWPAGDRELAEFVADHVDRRLAPSGWEQLADGPATVLGKDGGRRLRGTVRDDDGQQTELTVEFCLDGGQIFVITSLARGDEAVKAESAAIARSVRAAGFLRSDPAAALVPADADQGADKPGPAVAADDEMRLTFEEALAVAARTGVATLPGVDPRYLSGLDDPGRELALYVAGRSVEARGGFASGPLGTALDLATRHTALLTVDGPYRERHWFAVRAESAVAVRTDPAGGTIGLRLLRSAELIERLLDGVGEAMSEGPLPDVAVLEADGARPTLVRGIHRRDSVIAGGEVEWFAGPSGSWRVSRQDDGTAALSATHRAELRAALTELIPTTHEGALS